VSFQILKFTHGNLNTSTHHCRKKHSSVVDDLKHDYELKLHHFSVAQKNYDTLQTRLVDAESQLDKAVAQLAQAERLQRSQAVVGETWEQQYRGAMQEVESLRDENAALKSKIRRQYKQIELLTRELGWGWGGGER